MVASGISSVVCLMNFTFNYDSTMIWSRKLGLTDNIFYSSYLLSMSFTFYHFISILIVNDYSKEQTYLRYFKFIIVLNTLLFILSILMIFYYNQRLNNDMAKVFLMTIILCKEINSVLFHINFLTFIIIIKSTLNIVDINLTIVPEIDYNVDLDINNKFTY